MGSYGVTRSGAGFWTRRRMTGPGRLRPVKPSSVLVRWMAWAIRNPAGARAVLRATPLLARNGRRALRGEPATAPAGQAGRVLWQSAVPAQLEIAPSPTWRQGIARVGRLWVRTKEVPVP